MKQELLAITIMGRSSEQELNLRKEGGKPPKLPEGILKNMGQQNNSDFFLFSCLFDNPHLRISFC